MVEVVWIIVFVLLFCLWTGIGDAIADRIRYGKQPRPIKDRKRDDAPRTG